MGDCFNSRSGALSCTLCNSSHHLSASSAELKHNVREGERIGVREGACEATGSRSSRERTLIFIQVVCRARRSVCFYCEHSACSHQNNKQAKEHQTVSLISGPQRAGGGQCDRAVETKKKNKKQVLPQREMIQSQHLRVNFHSHCTFKMTSLQAETTSDPPARAHGNPHQCRALLWLHHTPSFSPAAFLMPPVASHHQWGQLFPAEPLLSVQVSL